jgi:hypothetical protein
VVSDGGVQEEGLRLLQLKPVLGVDIIKALKLLYIER